MTSSVRAEYDREARGYDRRWRQYNRRSLELLRPYLAGSAPGRVLDVGCGTGNLLGMLERWGVRPGLYVGVDLSPAMLRIVREKGSIPAAWVAADTAALPFSPGTFDLAVSASSLHIWREPAAALRRIHATLRPGGRLLLVDWCADFLSIRLLDRWLRWTGRAHRGSLRLRECAALLRESGFRVVDARRRRITLLWGLMVAEAAAE